MKVENDESKEEDEQSDCTEDDNEISPAHVVADFTALLSRLKLGIPARLEIYTASISRHGTEGYGRCKDDTNGLP